VDIIDRVEVNGGSTKLLKICAGYVHAAARKRITLYRDEGFEVQIVK
jgi:hypothetical protein